MKTAVLVSLLYMLPAVAAVQDTGVAARIDQVQIGRSTLDDLTQMFGEPARFTSGSQTFTRAKLPVRYQAAYEGFAVSMRDNVAREILIETPLYRGVGGVHVGSTVAEVIQALGEPKTIVKGAPVDGVPPGTLFEGTAERPGAYAREDLGIAVFLRGGRVSAVILIPRRLTPPGGGRLAELPRFDPNSRNPFQLDLRGRDLSGLDLRNRASDLLMAAVFDSRTVWPPRERMPEGFDPERVMDAGKNPGLGVRSLHKRGITGRGVTIAVIDNPLFASHQEYAGRLRGHEHINSAEQEAHFHASTVLSIAAGEAIGVAPGADLYFVSCWASNGGEADFTPRAKAFERLLEINGTLPVGKKIRVISMSVGWGPHSRGAVEMDAAVKRAKEEGLLVISPNIETTHGFRFQGLGRAPLADPDSFDSYEPGAFWAKQFDARMGSTDRLLVPMDSRTGAGPHGKVDYIYFRQGGWSWSVPYLAGVYALAAQVDPGDHAGPLLGPGHSDRPNGADPERRQIIPPRADHQPPGSDRKAGSPANRTVEFDAHASHSESRCSAPGTRSVTTNTLAVAPSTWCPSTTRKRSVSPAPRPSGWECDPVLRLLPGAGFRPYRTRQFDSPDGAVLK